MGEAEHYLVSHRAFRHRRPRLQRTLRESKGPSPSYLESRGQLLRLPTKVRETELRHDGACGARETNEQRTQEDSYWPHWLGWLCLLMDCREIQGRPTKDVPLLQIRASKGQTHSHRETSYLRGLRGRQGSEPHCLQARAPPRQLERLVSLHFCPYLFSESNSNHLSTFYILEQLVGQISEQLVGQISGQMGADYLLRAILFFCYIFCVSSIYSSSLSSLISIVSRLRCVIWNESQRREKIVREIVCNL